MLKYLGVDKLSSIKNKMPTLTIFVPSLPNDSFSAEEWDVKVKYHCCCESKRNK